MLLHKIMLPKLRIFGPSVFFWSLNTRPFFLANELLVAQHRAKKHYDSQIKWVGGWVAKILFLTRQIVKISVFNSDFRPRSGRSKFRFSDCQAHILQTRSGIFAIYRSCMFVLMIIGHRLAFPIGGRTFSTFMQRYIRDLPLVEFRF